MRGTLHSWKRWVSRRLGVGTLIFFTLALAGVVICLEVLSWKEARRWHGQVRQARHVLAAEQRSRFRTAVVYQNQGNNLFNQGDMDAAVEQYRRALEMNPQSVTAHANLGTALAQQGKLDEAIRHYRQALKINSRYAAAHFNLGILLGETGDIQGAIGHLRRVTEIDPADAAAHLQLGKFLKIAGKLQEADREAKQAARLQASAKPEAGSSGASGKKTKSAAN